MAVFTSLIGATGTIFSSLAQREQAKAVNANASSAASAELFNAAVAQQEAAIIGKARKLDKLADSDTKAQEMNRLVDEAAKEEHKVVLEFIPRYQHKLSEELAKWGDVTRKRLVEAVGEFYEAAKDEEAVSFIWGRTILSEAPGESEAPVEVPMLRSMWLSKKRGDKKALRSAPQVI